MRAAFAGDLELVKLLLAHGADPTIVSKDGETMVAAAAGLGVHPGLQQGQAAAERLEVVKLFVGLGADVNAGRRLRHHAADGRGATWATSRSFSTWSIAGADLGAYDLGKKNDGAFGASVEPLMPIDYAIGVGTFVPNNAVIIHDDAVALMHEADEGARHHAHDVGVHAARLHVRAGQRRSEGRDAGRDREDAEAGQIGHQVEGITGGLEVKEK